MFLLFLRANLKQEFRKYYFMSFSYKFKRFLQRIVSLFYAFTSAFLIKAVPQKSLTPSPLSGSGHHSYSVSINYFVLSFPPLSIALSIYYVVEIIRLHVNTSTEQGKHLITGLKEICRILGSVKLLFLSAAYSYFLFIERTNSQRSNAGQPNSCHLKWWKREKELKMAKGLEDLNRIKE